ncbi:hypothetical protein [Nitrosomonas sp. ANs5]|uniref:hypothetical protein n=1 Tax=Nitrosomonas sp. ANs5 TaxID=3423941 RepID=UPI003D356DB7
MDEKLPFWENLSLRIHLFLCRNCANFSQQLRFLRDVSRHDRRAPNFHLTEEAKRRIVAALANKENGD